MRLSVQVFGLNPKALMMTPWVLSHHIGKAFASRGNTSTPQIATKKLLVHDGLEKVRRISSKISIKPTMWTFCHRGMELDMALIRLLQQLGIL